MNKLLKEFLTNFVFLCGGFNEFYFRNKHAEQLWIYSIFSSRISEIQLFQHTHPPGSIGIRYVLGV